MMKALLMRSLLTGSFFLILIGCKKEEIIPQEMIEGKWVITSQEMLATVTPGDGSYLVFNACLPTCSGTDYRASDASSGIFTYTLNGDGTQIVIVDTSTTGGNYNFAWDILELTESTFRMTTSTILGNLKIEMTKE